MGFPVLALPLFAIRDNAVAFFFGIVTVDFGEADPNQNGHRKH